MLDSWLRSLGERWTNRLQNMRLREGQEDFNTVTIKLELNGSHERLERRRHDIGSGLESRDEEKYGSYESHT